MSQCNGTKFPVCHETLKRALTQLETEPCLLWCEIQVRHLRAAAQQGIKALLEIRSIAASFILISSSAPCDSAALCVHVERGTSAQTAGSLPGVEPQTLRPAMSRNPDPLLFPLSNGPRISDILGYYGEIRDSNTESTHPCQMVKLRGKKKKFPL